MASPLEEPLPCAKNSPLPKTIVGALRALDADLQAALALSRATLRALAALSPVLNTAADAALEDEAERCAQWDAPQRTLDIVE